MKVLQFGFKLADKRRLRQPARKDKRVLLTGAFCQEILKTLS